ncbi:hypothetical protein V6N12_036737, partial [Hibiscus sabdariffa]
AGTVLDAFVGARSWECVADVHTPNSDDVRDSPLGHMVSGEGGTETVGLLSGKIPSPTVVVGSQLTRTKVCYYCCAFKEGSQAADKGPRFGRVDGAVVNASLNDFDI